jgi:hypothetical protein
MEDGNHLFLKKLDIFSYVELRLLRKVDEKTELTIRIIPEYYPLTKFFISPIFNRKFGGSYEKLYHAIRTKYARTQSL